MGPLQSPFWTWRSYTPQDSLSYVWMGFHNRSFMGYRGSPEGLQNHH
jgi:hypothetical protein